MSSTSSSRSSISSKTRSRTIPSNYAIHGFRDDILEPNNILLRDGVMDEEQWSDLAFSLGMHARVSQRFDATTHKLAQKMRKSRTFTASQTYSLVKPFIDALVTSCPKLSRENRCTYHGDAVPTVDSLKNTVHRLPTPKPTMSVGYSRDAFSLAHDELQNGIIAGPDGEPCDLNHISQPISNHFWPFLTVEISDHSLSAARQANAISAATCNNALNLLAGAAANDSDGLSNKSFTLDHRFSKSFSVAIHGKVATLSVHELEEHGVHTATQLDGFQLDREKDVASLADRLHNIMVWAHYDRLSQISTTLDHLDRKVHGNLSGLTLKSDDYDFDPHCLKTLKLQQPTKRPDKVKVLLRAGLPSWLT